MNQLAYTLTHNKVKKPVLGLIGLFSQGFLALYVPIKAIGKAKINLYPTRKDLSYVTTGSSAGCFWYGLRPYILKVATSTKLFFLR